MHSCFYEKCGMKSKSRGREPPAFVVVRALCRFAGKGLAVYFLHVGDEVENLVGVTDLVVVPADNLHEVVGQVHTGSCVED